MHINKRLLVSYIAFEGARRGYRQQPLAVELSQRTASVLLRYGRNSRVTTVLNELRRDGWIELATASSGITGNKYTLGPMSRASLDDWLELGDRLYGPSGLLGTFLDRPCIKHGYLGPIGCIVLEFVRQNGPVARSSVVRELSGIASKNSVRAHTKKLEAIGLVSAAPDLSTPADLDSRIIDYEHETGAWDRARLQDDAIATERGAHRDSVLGPVSTREWRTLVSSLPCVYCGSEPRTGRGQVEHYPPRHWGGSDQTSLLLPACPTCNHGLGSRLHGSPKIPAPDPFVVRQIVFPGGNPDEAAEFLCGVMLARHWAYYEALVHRELDAAAAAVRQTFPIWCALVLGGVQIVDPQTGAITVSRGLDQPFFDPETIYLQALLLRSKPDPMDDLDQ